MLLPSVLLVPIQPGANLKSNYLYACILNYAIKLIVTLQQLLTHSGDSSCMQGSSLATRSNVDLSTQTFTSHLLFKVVGIDAFTTTQLKEVV